MHPIFIDIPIPGFLQGLLGQSFAIHTYGLMVALGFFFAISVVTRQARRHELDPDLIVNMLFGLILWGVIGSRLLFVALEWKSYVDRPLSILNIREGGLVFLGGVICAALYGLYYVHKHQLPFWKVTDSVVIGVPLGQMFGRLGCVAAGCCYGKPTDLPWAITFTSELSAGAPLNVPLHPVQIYESIGNLLIFLALYLWARSGKQRFDGQIVIGYFMLYPILRISTELFRGDTVRGFFMQETLGQLISTSQLISLLLLLAAAGAYVLRSRAGNTLSGPGLGGPDKPVSV